MDLLLLINGWLNCIFEGPEEMQQALGSHEGKAMAADLGNFASGGVTIIMGAVQN